MFSNLILRNSKRNRKENGLFFGSLIISIVAFYMDMSVNILKYFFMTNLMA